MSVVDVAAVVIGNPMAMLCLLVGSLCGGFVVMIAARADRRN